MSSQNYEGQDCNPRITQRCKDPVEIVPMAEAKPACFNSVQEGKRAQGNITKANQKGKPLSGGQGVRIRDYFQKSEANPEKGEGIKGNQASKLASVEVSKNSDSMQNPEEEVHNQIRGFQGGSS